VTDEDRSVPLAPVEGKQHEQEAVQRSRDTVASIPRWIQVVWVALAGLGFIDAIFWSKGGSFPWHPMANTLALAWLVFGVIGLFINRVENVGLPGGAGFTFRKLDLVERAAAKSEVSVEALRGVLSDYSHLMQNWLQSVNLFAEQLEQYAQTDDDVSDILAHFCFRRMEEARKIVAERGDPTRFSFWWFVEDAGGLKLLFSDDIRDEATLDHVFKPGAGLLGQCYVESRIFNEDDAPSSIYYERITPHAADYHGLLLVPVRSTTDERPIGVLSVDRQKKEAFNQNASSVCRALADLIAYAMETALNFEPGDLNV
jgi:hypothetical protein